jgi:hypothetical protein
MARPTLINPARTSNILTNIRNGAYFKHAAEASGVSYMTAYTWDSKGQQRLAFLRLNPGTEDVDDVLADWLEVYGDDTSKDAAIWTADPPMYFKDDPAWDYVLFSVLYAKAKAEAVVASLSVIKSAGAQQWTAHAFWLERTHPEEYGKQKVVTHQGPDGGPVEVAIASQEELVEKLLKLKETKSAE